MRNGIISCNAIKCAAHMFISLISRIFIVHRSNDTLNVNSSYDPVNKVFYLDFAEKNLFLIFFVSVVKALAKVRFIFLFLPKIS